MTGTTPRDSGSTIAGWLLRVALALGVLGLVAMDGISVLSTRLQVEDAANQAASAAASAARTTLNRDSLIRTAAVAIGPDYRIDPASVTVAGDRTVTLQVHRTADTIMLRRIGPLAHYAEFSRTASARSAT